MNGWLGGLIDWRDGNERPLTSLGEGYGWESKKETQSVKVKFDLLHYHTCFGETSHNPAGYRLRKY